MSSTISVIIPAKDEERYIAGTIESFLTQSIPHELIVVSNGSSDNTAVVARDLGAKVVELEESNKGVARNVGADASKGSILIFNDADIVVPVEYLTQVLAATEAGFDYGGPSFAAENNRLLSHLYVDLAICAMRCFKASGGAMFVRKDLFEKVGKFNPYMMHGGNSYLSKKLRRSGAKYALLPCSVTPSLRRFDENGYARELLIATIRFVQGQAQPL